MILLTGGAGYIGCVLAEELLAKGETVRIYDKLYFGEEGLGKFRDKVEVVQGDIRQLDAKVLDGINSVIHLAGLSNDPTAEFNPKANHEMNAVATGILARACKEHGIKRFTFASSCSIYDRGLFAEDVLYTEESEVAPRAAYAVSNYDAEKILLDLCDDDFCPVILRQGTVYGFSPRMRYDLVVNTFVKDALMKGVLTVNCGGEMWRPLIDVSDVAKAHICCVEAPEDKIKGQIFNLSFKNFRILELAHWVREALRPEIKVDIEVDYSHFKTRSYRVSSRKIETVLDYKPTMPVKESVEDMIKNIREYGFTDFLNPRYYNIAWMTLLAEMEKTISKIGTVF